MSVLCLFLTTGEVLVWNLNREDDMLMATSGIGNDAHREPVSKVHWIPDISSKAKGYNVIIITISFVLLA